MMVYVWFEITKTNCDEKGKLVGDIKEVAWDKKSVKMYVFGTK